MFGVRAFERVLFIVDVWYVCFRAFCVLVSVLSSVLFIVATLRRSVLNLALALLCAAAWSGMSGDAT